MNNTSVPIGQEFGSPLGIDKGIGLLIGNVISLALAAAGIIFLFLLVGGGFAMIQGAGSDNPEQAQKGKQAATSAVIGFVVVIAAYWIVRLIEIFLGGEPFITAPKF